MVSKHTNLLISQLTGALVTMCVLVEYNSQIYDLWVWLYYHKGGGGGQGRPTF